MGKRGPAAKPKAAHKRSGNYRPSRHGKGDAPASAPKKPRGMTPTASKAWNRVVPDLDALGYLNAVDQEGLRQLCEAIAEHDDALADIKKSGLVITEVKGDGNQTRKPNPSLVIRQNARKQVVSLLAQFGMTPAARTGLDIGGGDGSDFMRLLAEGGSLN
ncbi:MAG: phage terminase small subunit P27 family [Planctomycetota bacterium]